MLNEAVRQTGDLRGFQSITELVTLSVLKNSVNSVGTLRVRSGKETLDSRSYIRARLGTCLRLSTIDEVVSRRSKFAVAKQVNKIKLLWVCL